MPINQRIKELRGKMTLKEFVEPLGVSMAAISSIENGRSNLSLDLAEKICEVYGCSMDWLVRGIGTKNGETAKVEEPKADYITISKDELIQLQRLALGIKDEQIGELKKQVSQTKNIEGVPTGQ